MAKVTAGTAEVTMLAPRENLSVTAADALKNVNYQITYKQRFEVVSLLIIQYQMAERSEFHPSYTVHQTLP